MLVDCIGLFGLGDCVNWCCWLNLFVLVAVICGLGRWVGVFSGCWWRDLVGVVFMAFLLDLLLIALLFVVS